MKKIILFTALLMLVSCSPQAVDEPEPVDERTAKYEATEDDIILLLSQENVTSLDFSVRGVMLGHSERDVLNQLGSPDNYTRFEGEGMVIENMEYGESIGLDRIGLIVHLENDVVTRITMDEDFNQYLEGETRVEGDKADIYFLLGSADNTEILSKYILIQYSEQGIEFVTFRGDEVGLSLVEPGEVVRNISTEPGEQYYVPYSDEIVFR